MSVPIHFDDLNKEDKDDIVKKLTIKEQLPEKNKFKKKEKKDYYFSFMNNENAQEIETYDIKKYKNHKSVFLPLNYCYEKYGDSIFLSSEDNIPNIEFKGKLTDIQKEVSNEALMELNKKRSIIISLPCGLGKTYLALYLLSILKKKTLILVHRIVLINQWIESIQAILKNVKIQICDSSTPPDKDYDMYIMNMINVEKVYFERFEEVGIHVLVVDEVHVVCAKMMSKCLLYIFPEYLIGLSATPSRSDGMDKILDVYFGEYRIIRKIQRPHIVYKISTKYEIEIEMTKQNRLNWNSVINSQTFHDDRNNFIINILLTFKDITWLVLCKRVEHIKILREKLKAINNDEYCVLFGNEQTYDTEARILIATYSKCSVGFNHPKLSGLILASDIAEFEQTHGRVFRDPKIKPIFIDLVDDFKPLKNHWYSRKKIYDEMGGDIKNYSLQKFKTEFNIN